MRRYGFLRRGKMEIEPWMGVSCYPVGPKIVGGTPAVRACYDHLQGMHAETPMRAIGITAKLPPVPYNRMDYIVQLENALALQRVENQISVTLSQLALGIRNAEDFLEKHLLNREVRPSIYQLWFSESGLREHQHILSNLAAHHLVPLFSLVSYDVERGKMTPIEARQLYEELMDCSVAQPVIVQRELANQMVRVHCLDDECDRAMEVIEEMRRKRIRRTFVTYAPLFRHIRQREDAKRQVELLQFMYRVEGGRLGKFIFIDVPRLMYLNAVFMRYNWVVINMAFTATCTIIFLAYFNAIPM